MLLELPEETIYFRRPRSRSVFDRYGNFIHMSFHQNGEVRAFKRAWAHEHPHQIQCCSHTRIMDVDKNSDQKLDLWSL